MSNILRLAVSTFLILASSGAFASDHNVVQCRVERVAGLFYSFTQPQVGDTFQLNISSLDTTALKLGSALISLPGALKNVSNERHTLLSAEQSSGGTRYAFQLIIAGELSSMSSVINHQGNGSSSIATAELSCSTIE